MVNINWRFPPLSGGNEQGFANSGLEMFKGEELIDNLTREICQNSLDAKQIDSEYPVIVKFTLKNVLSNSYDVFSGYAKCLEGCKRYWNREEQGMDKRLENFLARAEDTLNKLEIPVLVISDYNTTGLTGSESSGKSVWKALTYSDGTSLKNDAGSGGSYGIGKNAPFTCSDLSMVFYNTYATDGIKAFKGVSRLATIYNEDNIPTQSIGHYQNNCNDDWKPIYGGDGSLFRDLFDRTEYGTDIIIVGFNEIEDWKTKIEKAIIYHFFPAIYENKLIVYVDDSIIDSTVLESKINDEHSGDKKIKITKQLFSAMIAPDNNERLLSILEDNDAEIFIKSDSGYSRTIANFRSTGMLVGTYYRRILQHYATVLIVRGQALNELLKDTEPPRHNRWDYTLIDQYEPEKRELARKCIKKIEDVIFDLLVKQYETPEEDTIDSDTGDYISDDDADQSGDLAGDDVLRIKQQIGKPRKKETVIEEASEEGKRDSGTVIDNDITVHNDEDNPKPKPTPPRPHVEPSEDDITGDSTERGSKTLELENKIIHKVFPLNVEQGIYKAVLIPDNNYENVYISFAVVGEDGTSDDLKISQYTLNGKKHSETNRVGPMILQRDELSEVVIRFEMKEKMMLRMKITGGRVV